MLLITLLLRLKMSYRGGKTGRGWTKCWWIRMNSGEVTQVIGTGRYTIEGIRTSTTSRIKANWFQVIWSLILTMGGTNKKVTRLSTCQMYFKRRMKRYRGFQWSMRHVIRSPIRSNDLITQEIKTLSLAWRSERAECTAHWSTGRNRTPIRGPHTMTNWGLTFTRANTCINIKRKTHCTPGQVSSPGRLRTLGRWTKMTFTILISNSLRSKAKLLLVPRRSASAQTSWTPIQSRTIMILSRATFGPCKRDPYLSIFRLKENMTMWRARSQLLPATNTPKSPKEFKNLWNSSESMTRPVRFFKTYHVIFRIKR